MPNVRGEMRVRATLAERHFRPHGYVSFARELEVVIAIKHQLKFWWGGGTPWSVAMMNKPMPEFAADEFSARAAPEG